MREDWGLTPYQTAMLTLALVGGTSVIVLPSILAAYAGQTAWLSALLPLPAGLLPLLIWRDLDRRLPGLTLLEQARAVLGPAGSIPVGAGLIALFASVCPAILRQFADLISAEALPRTPEIVVLGLMMVVPLYGVRQGPEVVARLAEILVPLAVGALVILGSAGLKDVVFNHLRPFMAQGPGPVLQGSLEAAAWYAETALLTLLLPFHGYGRRLAITGAVAGLLIAAGLTAVTTAWTVAVLGPLAGRVTFPIFQVTRVTSVAKFLTHLDSMLVVAWVAAGFVKTAVWFYALCTAVAATVGLRDYRPLTVPLAGLVVVGAMTWWASSAQLTGWVFHDWVFWGLSLELGIPAAVWIGALVRAKAPRAGRVTAP